MLEALVSPAFISAHGEPTQLTLTSDGLQVTLRSGRHVNIRRGDLREVRLALTSGRDGIQLGELELHRERAKPIRFREPLSAPLGVVGQACTEHMQVALMGSLAPQTA